MRPGRPVLSASPHSSGAMGPSDEPRAWAAHRDTRRIIECSIGVAIGIGVMLFPPSAFCFLPSSFSSSIGRQSARAASGRPLAPSATGRTGSIRLDAIHRRLSPAPRGPHFVSKGRRFHGRLGSSADPRSAAQNSSAASVTERMNRNTNSPRSMDRPVVTRGSGGSMGDGAEGLGGCDQALTVTASQFTQNW